MANIEEVINSAAIGEYIEGVQTEQYLGETLFPVDKTTSLELKFIKGHNGAPVALRPSTLGSRAIARERIGATEITNELPFFREEMVINEKDRRAIFAAQNTSDIYLKEVIGRVYDDADTLYKGAKVQSERMRMALLAGGVIHIQAADKDGKQPVYDFNYNVDGKWGTSNKKTLTGAARWKNHDTSDPINDINSLVAIADKDGKTVTRGIINPNTFADIMANANIKAKFSSGVVISKQKVIALIAEETGITIAINKASYKDENKKTQYFFPDEKLTLIPDGTLGKTVYGYTPEEIDLINDPKVDVSVVDTGIAITTVKDYGPPVTYKTVVSELVLPSFERMDEVYILNV